MTSIGSNAFFGCGKLTTVTVKNATPVSLSSDVFPSRTSITLVVPEGCKEAYAAADYWKEFKEILEGNAYQGVEINGICYNLFDDGFKATVVANTTSKYSGSVDIPESVTYEGNAYQVTSIGEQAFYYCSGLTSVTIPSGVTSIGEYAFQNCSGLTSITIPNCMTSIDYNAFDGCNTLTTVTVESATPISFGWYVFPNRVNSILIVPEGSKEAYAAADYWKEFKEITEGNVYSGVEIDGICYNLMDDGFKATVVAYATSKYSGNITIPESVTYEGNTYQVTSINGRAFYDCQSLSSVIIPSSVASIGDYAFLNCYRLNTITVKNATPISINSNVFYTYKDAILVVPEGSKNAYAAADTWKNFFITDKNVYKGVEIDGICYDLIDKATVIQNTTSACSGSITIPESVTYEGYSYQVTAIDYRAFYNCSGLTAITIPSSVTSIGSSAFYNCSGLTAITIPSSVTSIDSYAFEYCSKLTSIDIPSSVTSIGDYAFRGCSKLSTVTVENATPISISSDVFSNRSNATLFVPNGCKDAYAAADFWKDFKYIIEKNSEAITFADATVKALCVENWDTNGDDELSMEEAATVTSIGTVFKGNSSITSFDELQYFTMLSSISSEAFCNCSSLTSVTIPNNVTSIGSSAFYGCSKLTSIDIPSSVTSIGSSAFSGCNGLTSVTIPSSVTDIGDYAFSNCSGLTSISVESGNVNFDSRDNCNAIIRESDNTLIAGCKNTIIPSSVTSIGNYAFYGCSKLTSIDIPSSVTSIGSSAFYGCKGLTAITIPSSVTSIGDDAFSRCSGLTAITIPSSVTSIGSYTFYSCSGLTSVTIPSSVTSIGSSAFYSCSGLTAITIPSSVTDIGDYAFSNCSGLTSVTIPSSVTSIGSSAFYGCSKLTTVVVENASPVEISSYVFSSRKNATLYVPAGSKAAYEAADYWKEFNLIVENKNIAFADATVKALCVAKWDTNGDGEMSMAEAAAVTDLGNAFCGNTAITSFDELKYFTGLTALGVSVEGLGEITADKVQGFYGCTSLTSVTIPNNVTSLGDYAFNGCSSLTSVTVRWTKPVTITEQCFTNRANATLNVPAGSAEAYAAADYWKEFGSTAADNNIVFADDIVRNLCVTAWDTDEDGGLSEAEAAAVTDLGKVFSENSEITSFNELQYFTGLTEIGSRTFYSCSGLTSVTIPSSVTSIGSSAFYSCSGLTSVTIPSSVTSIGVHTFEYCSGLTAITIPSSVTSIGDDAFRNCSGLTSISVESGNVNFDSRDNCNAIIRKSDNTLIAGCKNTIIPSSVTYIGSSAFEGCSGLTSITIPSSVTEIGSSAFEGCSGLTSITIPSSVTSIDYCAFQYCSGLTSITIPSSVTYIGSWAFYGCSKLTTVVVKNASPVEISSYVFSSRKKATLYVPAGSKAAYEAADYWKEFKEIIEYEELEINGAGKLWDFTKGLSAETIANLNADTDKWETNGTDDEGNTNNWLNVTNQGATSYWTANGVKIEELNGLKFDIGSYTRNSIHVATTKLRLTRANTVITFPKLRNGQKIKISGRSANAKATDRGIAAVQSHLQFLPDESSPQTDGKCIFLGQNVEGSEVDYTFVWKVETESTEGVDVQFQLISGGIDFKRFEITSADDATADYVLGDVNGNGGVDIGDAVSIVNYLVGKESTTFVEKAADTNKNGQIDIGDAVTIVNFLVGKTESLSRTIGVEQNEREPQ